MNKQAQTYASLGAAARQIIPTAITVWFTTERSPSRLAKLWPGERASVRQKVWTTGKCEGIQVTEEGIHYKISAPAPDVGPAETHSCYLDFPFGRISAEVNRIQVEPRDDVTLDYRVSASTTRCSQPSTGTRAS